MNGFADLRKKMVDSQLRTDNVTDLAVLAAVGSVPREAFVPARLKPLAYIDADLVIREADGDAGGRYLMEPAPFARLVQLAEIRRSDIVLDIGCGTGYSAAVLARLSDAVVAVECDAELAEQAAEVLLGLDIDNVAVVAGPLEAGYPTEGPYDVILIDGAVERVPETLFEQLKDGGRLVTVVGKGRAAAAMLYTRSDGTIASRTAFNADVRPLPGFGAPPAFIF